MYGLYFSTVNHILLVKTLKLASFPFKIYFIPVAEAPTPQPVKRTVGRKRKAPVDLEAEAEEHQKRREVQYQSLLAPSIQSSPTAPAVPSSGMDDHSFPQFSLPVLPDVPEPLAPHTSTEPVVPSFVDTSREFSEMENMGYDQVSILIKSTVIQLKI
jgi:hypothetical protein